MLKLEIICVSRLKKGALSDMAQDYKGRIRWPLVIHEIESKYTEAQKAQIDEQDKILKLIDSSAVVCALDERGKSIRSADFAKTIDRYTSQGRNHFQFILGGADGLTDPVRSKADFLLSFGQQTWPHLLARVMLLEQIYRAQQILSGHPYHRE